MRIRVPDNLTASRQYPGKASSESREPYCGTPEYTLQPSSPPESEPAILEEPAMNELHLRETAALELASPMTLPQQDAGIPPIVAGDGSICPAQDNKSRLELYAADGIIYFCVWAQLRTEARYDLYIGCT